MKPLAAQDALADHLCCVEAHARPQETPRQESEAVYAVFTEEPAGGEVESFLGLVEERDVAGFPQRIFADLIPEPVPEPVPPEASLDQVHRWLDAQHAEALPVIDRTGRFVGAVTRKSLDRTLLRRERDLLDRARRLQGIVEQDNQRLLTWSAQLQELNVAFQKLLGLMATSPDLKNLAQEGIGILATLIQARYGAVATVDSTGALADFVYTGITPEEADRIGPLPQGRGLLGVIIKKRESLCLEELSRDERSSGFPPHHPEMKSLLAVPIVYEDRVFGRIYLCDKVSGEAFTMHDRLLVESFAQTLSLVECHANEVLERRCVEENLRQSEARLRKVIDSAHDAFLAVDSTGVIVDWNVRAESTFGWSRKEAMGQKLVSLIIPASFQAAHEKGVEQFLAGGAGQIMGQRIELAALHRDGHEFPAEIVIWPIRLGEEHFFNAFVHDISERRKAEEKHDRMAAQLRQAQKMEAIGQLAGGVAHDFNNLLTVITGCTELISYSLQPGDALMTEVEEIQKAADRAASLTQQLLAFSRRQVFEPRVFDLNTVISSMEKMLRRLIGSHIEFETVLSAEPGYVKADPGGMEQILMNLAVNARDVMPEGGELSIETGRMFLDESASSLHQDLPPGPYVTLTVADTGCGMDAGTRSQIFDPFFTTKDVGKGTGLGLATVYGIVKQSGGDISVDSAPGTGTSFKVWFPRVEEEAAADHSVMSPGPSVQGSETVLLAEDEEGVRRLARRSLERSGYTVLEAGGGNEALRLARQHGNAIQLMVTDVVMPGMGGLELAGHLVSSIPGMKVLYISGYPGNAAICDRILDDGTAFLPKPFTPDALVRKVRHLLDTVPGQD